MVPINCIITMVTIDYIITMVTINYILPWKLGSFVRGDLIHE